MSKRKRKSSRPKPRTTPPPSAAASRDRVPIPLAAQGSGNDPWPLVQEFYGRLCEQVGAPNQVRRLFEDKDKLQSRVESLETDLQATRSSAGERIGQLERKCQSLEERLERMLRVVEEQKVAAVVSFLGDMADDRANKLLFKVLDGKDAEITLGRLADFLRAKGVEFVRTTGEQFELLEAEQHNYILKGPASLPCRVQVIARGIRINDQVVVRPEVEVVV